MTTNRTEMPAPSSTPRLAPVMALSLTTLALLFLALACSKEHHAEPPESAYRFGEQNVFDDGQRRVDGVLTSAKGLLDGWEERNSGCIACHENTGDPHVWTDETGEKHGSPKMGCTDCHGGNGTATTIEEAHPKPSYPEEWPTAANPEQSYMLNQVENWDWIRFVNPGDLRVAQTTCGSCHAEYVLGVTKGVMTTASHFGGVAAYANGIVSSKRAAFGESFGPDGKPQIVKTWVKDPETGAWRQPNAEEMDRHGWSALILPYPQWEITQVGNIYRVFEQGSRIGGPALAFNGLPVPIPGLVDRFEDPGRPNNKLSDRGSGTLNRVDLPILNVHKTRLNDPHLSMLGTNDNPGDYRSSGCSACHVVYANDRSPVHSGPFAKFGNMGETDPNNPDPTTVRGRSGHPVRHQFNEGIPSSQCMVCHMHQPNSFVNSYYGYQMWTYETDGEEMWPEQQVYPSHKEFVDRLNRNPEEAATRGLWGDVDFLKDVAHRLNPKLKHTQFADYHGHGWIFRGVFKMDRKGNLLDKDGAIVSYDDPDKFKGVIPIEGSSDPHFDPKMAKDARRAVHMKDIHAEYGMHCVDCHFSYGVHGTGHVYSEYQAAVQIGCKDCHGTVKEYADFVDGTVSGPVAEAQTAFGKEPQRLSDLKTPWGDRQFDYEEIDGREVAIQRSMVHKDKKWVLSQVRDSVSKGSSEYNEKAAYAKTIQKDNETWGGSPDSIELSDLAHSDDRMECYACHTSWVTACFGCHLPQRANMRTENHRFEKKYLRNYASYNPQVARDSEFLLGVSGNVKKNKIAPVRSSSAVMISSEDSQRRIIYGQLMTMAANGMSSQLFNTHFPHTVRMTETRTCDDCHVSEKDDNNAWLASTYLLGTKYPSFMGRNAYVGLGGDGFNAVRVGEWLEPQAVIGSKLHRMAYPDDFAAHQARGMELDFASHHAGQVWELQLRNEYLYTAQGSGGFRVYDVANVNNKDFSQKVVTAPVSPLGQDTHIALPDATSFVLPFNNNISMGRLYRPENGEQKYEYKGQVQNMHEAYRYAYVTDAQAGLVVVDIDMLTDGDPLNNFIEEKLRFNPEGLLNGARCIEFAGTTVYVGCDAGLVAIDIDDPLAPKVIAQVKAPAIVKPTSVRIQFRYLFVTDAEGLKVVDVTDPRKMAAVPEATKSIPGARDVWVARTYAYVAAGEKGIVIVDIEKPRSPRIDQTFNADGALGDTWQVKTAMTNDSLYAYVADGRGGMKVLSLVTPDDGGRSAYGFSPRPQPQLVAWYPTNGPAVAMSAGLERDRAVDESGNQITAFGRIGARPMNLEEMHRLYFKGGSVWNVSNRPKRSATAGTPTRRGPSAPDGNASEEGR
jgi:hypothetical protein